MRPCTTFASTGKALQGRISEATGGQVAALALVLLGADAKRRAVCVPLLSAAAAVVGAWYQYLKSGTKASVVSNLSNGVDLSVDMSSQR